MKWSVLLAHDGLNRLQTARASFAHASDQQSVVERHRCLQHCGLSGGQVSKRKRRAPKAQRLPPAAFWRSSWISLSCHLELVGGF